MHKAPPAPWGWNILRLCETFLLLKLTKSKAGAYLYSLLIILPGFRCKVSRSSMYSRFRGLISNSVYDWTEMQNRTEPYPRLRALAQEKRGQFSLRQKSRHKNGPPEGCCLGALKPRTRFRRNDQSRLLRSGGR